MGAKGRRLPFPPMTRWQRGFLLAAVICIGLYPVTVALEGDADASTLSGMLYGTLATALMLGSAYYGIRRRTMRRGWGRARAWQQFHLYGGALFFLTTLLHAAFRVPQGAMTGWLLGLSAWVSLSGFLGLVVQQWVQRSLRPLSVEALYERIPELVAHLRDRAEEIAAQSPVQVKEFHRNSLVPLLAGPCNDPRFFFRPPTSGGVPSRQFELLRSLLGAEDQERVQALEELVATKRDLDAHYTLQKALRWWLYAHVPPSVALVVLVGIHIVVVFSY